MSNYLARRSALTSIATGKIAGVILMAIGMPAAAADHQVGRRDALGPEPGDEGPGRILDESTPGLRRLDDPTTDERARRKVVVEAVRVHGRRLSGWGESTGGTSTIYATWTPGQI